MQVKLWPIVWTREKCVIIAIMAAVFVITSVVVTLRGELTSPTTNYNEQFRMAGYLLHGTGFVCPVGPERKDPSSWYCPGYISLMAGVLSLFGEGSGLSLALIRLLNNAAMSVTAGLYFLLSKRMFGSKTSWIALVLLVLNPAIMYKSGEIWDTSWCMLGGACLIITFFVIRPHQPLSLLVSGLACGAVAMVNPCFTLCYPVWVVCSWWRQRRSGQEIMNLLSYSGLVLLGFVLAILPWTIRNYRTFGEIFYLRGNWPMEVWVGNAPWSDGYFFTNDGDRRHPVFDPAEEQRMITLGEYGYFKACRADLAQWWQKDKARFLHLGLRRIAWFWFGRYDLAMSQTRKLLKIFGCAVPAVLAIFGSFVIVLKKREGLFLVLTLLVFGLIYYASVVMVRYRLPLEPVVSLVGAIGLVDLFQVIRKSSSTA